MIENKFNHMVPLFPAHTPRCPQTNTNPSPPSCSRATERTPKMNPRSAPNLLPTQRGYRSQAFSPFPRVARGARTDQRLLRKPELFKVNQAYSRLFKPKNLSASCDTTPCYRFEKMVGQLRSRPLTGFSYS